MSSHPLNNELVREVRAKATQLMGFPHVTTSYWFFVFTVVTTAIVGYLALLQCAGSILSLVTALTVSFSATSILAISVGHQGFHGALVRSSSVNKYLGILAFIPLGVDGALWRRRHVMDHHPKPNSKGHDLDLDNPTLLRLAPYTQRRWYHGFQHLYAPFIYSAGVVFTVCIDDFRSLVPELRRSGISVVGGFLLRKLLFVALWIVVPLALNPLLTPGLLIEGLCIATIPTAWIFLPIAAAHLNEETHFFASDSNLEFSALQGETTVDFCAHSRLMTMVYGGLNCHLAHHLWPRVAGCHYQLLYRIADDEMNGSFCAPNLTLVGLLTSHFKLLRRLGLDTP
jgi:linoleoyl-CoA desaturase